MDKQEFLVLIDKYLSGKATHEEEQLLLNFYESFQTKEEWDIEVLNEKQILERKMLTRLQESVSKERKKKNPKIVSLFSIRKIAASVALILFSASLYLWIPRSGKLDVVKTTEKVKKDIAPGGNKAVLRLADGSEIILDNAKNGILASQGHTSINKKEDGQLVYNAESAGHQNNQPVLPSYNTITTPYGGQYQLILPDGSKVWLNAASSLRFPTSFTGKERDVELTGEAYFEVAKNRDMPFKVTISPALKGDLKDRMQIEVLGTHFNVMAYDDEESSKTTLLEGSVKISKGEENKIIVPGQQAKVKEGHIQVATVDTRDAVAWKNGLTSFGNADIKSIMRQIARWYNVEVYYKGDMPRRFFTGEISRNANLSQVLKVLELSNIHFQVEEQSADKKDKQKQAVIEISY